MLQCQLTGNDHTARYPSLRTENSLSGPMPLGGIWQVDPAWDHATELVPLANPQSQSFRTRLINTLQKYGTSNTDTTLGAVSLRIEATNTGADSYQIADSANTILKSIPASKWRVISATYRPVGAVQIPPPVPLDQWRMTTAWLTLFGVTLDGAGRLTVPATNGGVTGSVPGTGTIRDTRIYVKLRQAASRVCFQVRNSSNSEQNVLQFNIDNVAGTIKSEVRNASTVLHTVSATYNPTNHAWLRIGHNDTTDLFTFDTSTDVLGVPSSWTSFDTFAVPGTFWDIDAVIPSFFSPAGGSGSAIFQSLSETPAPVAASPGWVVGVA
jgi:hypothetical protein